MLISERSEEVLTTHKVYSAKLRVRGTCKICNSVKFTIVVSIVNTFTEPEPFKGKGFFSMISMCTSSVNVQVI